MAEYWKSTPKYWCKHCKTFVVDTKLERTKHEATGRHKGALERFIRDLHRNNEKEARAKEAAKREVSRLEAIASDKSPAPSAATSLSSSTTTKWATTTARTLTESEKKAQLKQLESLGVALPDEYRKDVALPGDWKPVEPAPTTTTIKTPSPLVSKERLEEEENKEKLKKELLKQRAKEEKERKWAEMDQDERALRGFKIQTMEYPGERAEADEADFGAFSFGKSAKREMRKEEGEEAKMKQQEGVEGPAAGLGLGLLDNGGGLPVKREHTSDDEERLNVVIKQEEGAEVKAKLGDGVVFKKRKISSLRKK
ncbi:hypothetical protein BDZ91DRAFT_745288 [Kalaharituber pfeilii]|nr:hypothetical protein BDZ91DRAFT_745288 [Kalaharituber pfeilii]